MDLSKVTRFEVVDHREPGAPGGPDQERGRVLVISDMQNIWADVQDHGTTLKVFLT